jgi:hypothetical protein
MATKRRTGAVVGWLLAAVLAGGCGGGPAGRAPAAPGTTAPPGTTVESSTVGPEAGGEGARPVGRADVRGCPVTRPRPWRPPSGVAEDALFGAGVTHGNGKLWVGGLGEGGVIEAGPDDVEPDGSVGMKFGWWREAEGSLRISGRRLDGPARPLRANVPDGYGSRGFQASGVWFPTQGCWEVTGRVGPTSLSFVTFVVARTGRS